MERTLGDAIILLLFSAVLYVAIELPSINLCKYCLKPVPRRGSNSSTAGVAGSSSGLARHIQFLSNSSFSLKKKKSGGDGGGHGAVKKTSPTPRPAPAGR